MGSVYAYVVTNKNLHARDTKEGINSAVEQTKRTCTAAMQAQLTSSMLDGAMSLACLQEFIASAK